MAGPIISVSSDGELTIRSEALTRGQWGAATAKLREILGEPSRQAVEAEEHVHHIHGDTRGRVRRDPN